MININLPKSNLPRVVIAGGGFGGLKLAQELDGKAFQIVLIDRENYHQFPPLIYQVASSGLEPSFDCFPLSLSLPTVKKGFILPFSKYTWSRCDSQSVADLCR